MPSESSSSGVKPSFQPPVRRRQPPPTHPPPGQVSGPPSIGLDDSPHNEFDLGSSGGGALELDFAAEPGSGLPPEAEPPPAIGLPDESGLDFPIPADLRSSDSGIDLPGPVGVSTSGVHEDSNTFDLDLPAPVEDLPRPVPPPPRSRPAPFVAPPPPSRPPAAAPPAAGPPAAGPPAAGPPAAGPPAAGPPAVGPPATEMPSFSADLPIPVELDLPTPVSAQPQDRLELPLSTDLPTPDGGEAQMVVPAGLEVAPTNMGVTPSHLEVAPTDMGMSPSHLEVAPTNMGVTPSHLEVAPANLEEQPLPSGALSAGIPQPVGAAPGSYSGPYATTDPLGPGASHPGTTPAVVPPKTTSSRPPVSRGLLLAVGGLVILGLAGVGVLYSGILDPVDPEPASLRGGVKPKDGGEGKTPPPTPEVNGTAAERNPTVLATMAKHTPAAYLEARAAATQAGDAVGAAECGLLLHYHYGPNPSLVAEAQAALQPEAANPAGFVQRVVGLSAMSTGNPEGAEGALGGEQPRARLYRGWLRLSQGKLDEAKAEADAVLAALADEVSARHLVLSIAAQNDPVAAIPELQASVAKNAHPAMQALLAQTAVEVGLLAMARTTVDALDPAATEDPGVQAWIHAQHALVRAAQGDHTEALAAYDRALALVPAAPEVQVAHIRALLGAKRFNDASASVSALVREHPQDLDIQLLQAEVAIHSGDGDIALQVLDTLTKSLPKDARVMRLKGDVHGMRLEVDEGQTAFAAARAFDPSDYRATVGEAILLADAKRLPDALAVLETARAEADAAGRPRDVALLLVTKAQLHVNAGENNAARDALDRALEAVPTHNAAQLLRGSVRLSEGQVAEGRADLVAVFERTGGYPGLAAPLGMLFVLEGDFDSLERLVGDRLRGEQTPDDLLVVGIRLRLHQGRSADARALVEFALTRRPADWEVHMLKAELLISEGKAAEALAEIEVSRPAQPQAELMLQRGKILEFNSRHDDAIPEYRKALQLDPGQHEARFLFGRLLHYKGGHGKAITELRKVLDVPRAVASPWYPEVWLNIGLAQQAQGKYADAIASLRKATAIDPKLGEAWAKMGEFHENLNKHGEAISALTKAVAIGTKSDFWYADALMNLGRAQSKSGKKAAARKSLQEFLEVASPESTSRAEAERLLASL